jgi:hypothetical protein
LQLYNNRHKAVANIAAAVVMLTPNKMILTFCEAVNLLDILCERGPKQNNKYQSNMPDGSAAV